MKRIYPLITFLLIASCFLFYSFPLSALAASELFPQGWRLNRSGPTAATMEFNVIEDPAGAYKGKSYAYLKGHLMSDEIIFVAEDDELAISFYAKDPEGKDVTAALYAYQKNSQGRLAYITQLNIVTGKPGGKWTKIEGRITIPGKNMDKSINAVKVALVSRTGAYFDYAQIIHARTTEWKNSLDAYYEGTRKRVKGDYKEALRDFQTALNLAKTEEEKSLALSMLEETKQQAQIGEANAILKKVFVSADVYMKQGDYENARKEYEKIKNMAGTPYVREAALFNIAEIFCLEKDYAGAHKTFLEIFSIPGLTDYYRIYGLFKEAEVYVLQGQYAQARSLYQQIFDIDKASPHHVYKAELYTGDTYRRELKYGKARDIYKQLLIKEEASSFPNDGYRLDVKNRLAEIEGLADGMAAKSKKEKRLEKVNLPKYAIYVSLQGNDANPGTKEKPFATVQRAQEEVGRIKLEKGFPAGGIAVYLRGGKYFITKSIKFGTKDSGTESSPVVYRNYPGEEVRIIGGRQVSNFKLLTEPDILERLPGEAGGKVWVADLKESGITEYGKLLNRGNYATKNGSPGLPGALELIYNGEIMNLARWPNDGWARVAGLPSPDGEFRNISYQKNKFNYSEDRPKRWLEEKEIWLKGYMEGSKPYEVKHVRVMHIDAENRTMETATVKGSFPRWTDTPFQEDSPYFAYNLLSEIDIPGEWYLDRDTGRLYFYPPGKIEDSEIIVSTLDEPLLELKGVSNVAFLGLTLEGTWHSGMEIYGGKSNLVAGCIIRNTGQFGVVIKGGWRNEVVGCDIYDVGEGGILMEGGDREKLIPSLHCADNNHIYRFNRLCGGYRPAVHIGGIGQTASHNLIHDSPHQLIYFNANDHVIEFNELYDGPYEAREGGAIYVYGSPWHLMNRGTVIRNNFLHHISTHSSPSSTQNLYGVHIDAMNAGLVLTNNIFYKVPTGIWSTYPGNYLTNNFFIDVESMAIGQGDRSNLFCKNRDINAGANLRTMERNAGLYKSMRYKQPPWSYRYPSLVGMFEKEPATWGKIQGSIIERNVNTGGPFISFYRDVRNYTHFQDNWDGQNPLFEDPEHMNFSLRPGAPVYGITGVEPVDVENTGVYEDALRASWPVSRAPAGKYYNQNKVVKQAGKIADPRFSPLPKVSETPEYRVQKRTTSINIDGKLQKDEWLHLEKNDAMVIEQQHRTGKTRKGAVSYAWILYDDKYLYIGVENASDYWKEGLPKAFPLSLALNEITIEGKFNRQTTWWGSGLPTGPLYTFTGHYDGRVTVHNIFSMPKATVEKLKKGLEYKTEILDLENQYWTAEWKIPFSALSIPVEEITCLRFNIGVPKRGDWFAWAATGGSLWRVDNAGILRFIKK